jgi:two-component system phosphate regulon sensor histidine kinase PhoR
VLVAILSSRQRAIVVEHVEQRLHDSAVLLRGNMADVFQHDRNREVQDALKNLSRETGTRLTLVADDGTVLGDSEEDPAMMENHRDRDELLRARTAGFGVSRRPSPTLGIPMMYYALRVGDEASPAGFVRVAMPMESVDAQVTAVQWPILINSILVSAAALALTYLVVGRMIRPLATLTDAATKIASGNIGHEVDVRSRDELGTLAESFNSMSRELARRIDELTQQRKEFADNSERLEAVLGGMVDGVLAVDGSQRVLFANRAAGSLLEFAAPDFVGHPIWETVRNPTIQKLVQAALDAKAYERVEMELPRTQSTVEFSAIRLSGEPCPGVIIVMHDVTELRRLENIRQQFVSNVSHELKTPLTSIQAYTETLLGGAMDDPKHNREFLERIDEHAERLHALILDLLRLARIESGKDAFMLAPVSLGEAVKRCADEHADIAERKQVGLTFESAPGTLNVMADAEGLRTILDNLVENAINYTPEGGNVKICWRAENSRAVVEVIDTGVGIATKHRTRIFERFYRVDKARSRELGGTGLGLSIVKHLALEFGGNVEVDSELGRGSTFRVHLPLASPTSQIC